MSDFDEKARDWDTPKNIERAENIAEAIREQVSLDSDMSALDYGCGTGLLSFNLYKELGPITLADNSEGMLQVLREKINDRSVENMEPINLNLSTDPLPDLHFDLIYTMMTLHHIPDTGQILSQFYELLNPGGTLCVADLDKEDGSFHGHDVENVHRGFDREELANLAESIGFSGIEFTTAYQMDREIEDGSTRQFPIFLMVATKNG